jgi:magnesium transporter
VTTDILKISDHTRTIGLPAGSLVIPEDGEDEGTSISIVHYDELTVQTACITSLRELEKCRPNRAVSWINIDRLHDANVLRELGTIFHLHPLVLEDMLNRDQTPKIEDYGDYIYIVLKMLSFGKEGLDIEQVSIVLGENYVLSVQEDGKPGDVFDPIRSRIRNDIARFRRKKADFLAYSLIDAVVDNYFVVLENIGDRIESLEERVIDNPEKKMVEQIHELHSDTIFLRRSVWPLREVIGHLQRGGSKLLDDTSLPYLRDVYDHTIHVIDTVGTLRELLSSIRDIYLSSVSFRMNEIMRVLTVISTIFIPLTFVVGVYGMNFKHMPELEWSWAYPLLIAFMVGVAGAMIYFFRRKGWL